MNVLLVGTGNMARRYSATLSALGVAFDVVGNSQAGKEGFIARAGKSVFPGSLAEYLGNHEVSHAIVATSVVTLSNIALRLADIAVPKILIEKPVATSISNLEDLSRHASLRGVDAFVALNRRFFPSVQAARSIVAAGKGPIGLGFRFDDRISSIPFDQHPPEVLSKWVIANSIHVIDAAFFITGWPESLNASVGGRFLGIPVPSDSQASGNCLAGSATLIIRLTGAGMATGS